MSLPRGVTQIFDSKTGYQLDVFKCECCGRTQAYAPPSRGGGITARQAEQIGWERDLGPKYGCSDSWTCPICAGRAMGPMTREEGKRHARCCKLFKKISALNAGGLL